MTEVRENATAVGTGVLANYAYDNLGRRTSIARNNGTAMTTAYSYPTDDTRLATLAHNLSGSANDLSLTFGWTPASQLNRRTADNDAYSWASHYAEDLTATLNGLNQVTSFGADITYDARGNLVTDGTSTFGYDPQNRLTSATVPSGVASLTYDALGRLYEVIKSGAQGSTARFLYSASEAIAEYDAAGLKTRFVRGQAADEVLVQYDGGATLTNKKWLIADERGSIIGAANSSAVSQFKNAYDEYGRRDQRQTGPAEHADIERDQRAEPDEPVEIVRLKKVLDRPAVIRRPEVVIDQVDHIRVGCENAGARGEIGEQQQVNGACGRKQAIHQSDWRLRFIRGQAVPVR